MAQDDLRQLVDEALVALNQAQDPAALEEARTRTFGKKGRLTLLAKTLGQMDAALRVSFGSALNEAKASLMDAFDTRAQILSQAALAQRLQTETQDITLSVRPQQEGTIHPITQTLDEIIAIFSAMDFTVARGPDIETDWNNFTALNLPPTHPARQMHDTFYMPAQGEMPMVLRTHTSPVQIRTMLGQNPPIRIIAPGRTFRCDYDMTHTPMFHQFEGLVIDESTHMGHLKGCFEDFLRAFFGIEDLPLRFRPSHFPFTEPSAEVDIGCSRKDGALVLGNYGDWLEIGGCGMVHPRVLENCGIDPEKYQGFAFGTGIERLAMLKYGIPDLRTFFEGDVRWLKHYGFSSLDIPNLAMGLV
ncbi:MAG: phenylalanine--tRNA ligase subunit alpha [Alphaproteobacteria bacterium]|nr:phenylalanine--tRNA ligase subunit alpha [Alphaproteobacteria bacterium]